MRKTKYILLLLAVLLCLTGCNNDTEQTTTESTTPTETSLSIMERDQLEYKFQGEPRCVIRTAEATYKDSEGNILSSAEMDDIYIYGEGCEAIAEAVEGYFEFDLLNGSLFAKTIDQWRQTSNTRKLTCMRMDDAVVSVRTKARFYGGGGFSMIEGTTFDAESCEILELDDIIKDMEGFRKKVDEVLPGLVAEKVVWFEGYETPEALAEYTEYYRKDIPEWTAWFLSEEGIIFGFEEGLFTASAAGCLEVTIPYDDIKEYMVEKYVP